MCTRDNFYLLIYFCSWQNKLQSINKIKPARTTTIDKTGHGTHAVGAKDSLQGNLSKRTLRNYEPIYWYHYLPNIKLLKPNY